MKESALVLVVNNSALDLHLNHESGAQARSLRPLLTHPSILRAHDGVSAATSALRLLRSASTRWKTMIYLRTSATAQMPFENFAQRRLRRPVAYGSHVVQRVESAVRH